MNTAITIIFLEPNLSDAQPASNVISALLSQKLLMTIPLCVCVKCNSLLMGMMATFMPNNVNESTSHARNSSEKIKFRLPTLSCVCKSFIQFFLLFKTLYFYLRTIKVLSVIINTLLLFFNIF
ncbi:hypothetical protein D9M73_251910 [compost metagenome]